MESEITRKVEDAVATIAGIEQMTSTVDEGASTTSIEFRFGTDLSAALDDVRDAMTRIRSDLPADANEPIVSRVTTAGGAIVTWSVASDNMTRHRALVVRRLDRHARALGRARHRPRHARRRRRARDSRRPRPRSHGGARRDGERRLAATAPHPSRISRRRRAPRRPRADRAHDGHHHVRLRLARAADLVARRPQRAARYDRRSSRSGRRATFGGTARRRARNRFPDRAHVGRQRARRREGRARRRGAPAARVSARASSPRRARRSATSRNRSTPRWRC